jgi:hypothetical protein
VNLFKLHNHDHLTYEILRWDPFQGPIILNRNLEIDSSLQKALENGTIQDICSTASILLEKICNSLSHRLPISVTRRADDKYTIGDLWPGIYKVMKKTSVSKIAEELNKVLS